MKEEVIVILGENTPREVCNEVNKFKDSAVLNFNWDDEDNEMMPETAKYLAERYNLYRCGIV